ncbi:helix-turn-helix domain-containing protein [Ekhidna sp.]
MSNPSNRIFSAEEAFKHFPERLVIARKHRNMYANSLAISADLRQSTVSNYETGKTKPTSSNFFRICEILDTHPNYLCGLSDQIEYRNLAVLIEDMLMNMSKNDQEFIFNFIRDFRKHFYSEKGRENHYVVPYPGASARY